jgi:hypothetical protein
MIPPLKSLVKYDNAVQVSTANDKKSLKKVLNKPLEDQLHKAEHHYFSVSP